MNRLGDALSLDPARLALAHYRPRPIDRAPAPEDAGPPVKALIVYNSNPAAVTPDQNAVLGGCAATISSPLCWSISRPTPPTMPTTSCPRRPSSNTGTSIAPTVTPICRSTDPPLRRWGRRCPTAKSSAAWLLRLGYDEPCFHESDEAILRDFVAAQTHPRFAGLTWEQLLAEVSIA
jgi:hypothetical protein